MATPSHLLLLGTDSVVIRQYAWFLEPIHYFEVFIGSNWLLGKNISQTTLYSNSNYSNSSKISVLA